MDELTFAESFRPAAPVTVQDVLARQLATPDREELAAVAADRAVQAEAENRRETQALLNRQLGDPLGQVSRAQAVVASCRDEVADLEARLDVARGRLRQAGEAFVDWSATADEVMVNSARRSDTHDLLAPVKEMLSDERVRQMVAVRAQAPARRPKGHGGVAVRSEHCADCIDQGATDDEAFLIHNDPDHPLSVTPPGQAAKAKRRSSAGYSYAEAVR